eukprot:11207766-Lingulodinium_polyedra.AAC.1
MRCHTIGWCDNGIKTMHLSADRSVWSARKALAGIDIVNARLMGAALACQANAMAGLAEKPWGCEACGAKHPFGPATTAISIAV